MTKTAVVALGGNAFTVPGQSGTSEEMLATAAMMGQVSLPELRRSRRAQQVQAGEQIDVQSRSVVVLRCLD